MNVDYLIRLPTEHDIVILACHQKIDNASNNKRMIAAMAKQ